MRSLSFFVLMISILVSCKKPEDRKCAKSTGETDTLEMALDIFDRLHLHEHLVYELIQDSTNRVVLQGGKNLLNLVNVTVSDGLLDIRNENRCNFLRSYKNKIKVEIHFTNISDIQFEGSEPMFSRGKLKFDWLTFLIRDGAGSVDLNFDAQRVYATISHGWGDFTFRGNVQHANLIIRSNGYCDLLGMNISDSVTVVSNTQGAVKVFADGIKIKAQTLADGNIYYKGTPAVIQFEKLSGGQLIKL